MLLYVLDQDFETLELIDNFIELIWAERYRTCGDFELYLPVNMCVDPYLTKGNYLHMKGSDQYMIIEDTKTITNAKADAESMHKIVGRDLSSILDRRVIWKQIDFTGTVQNLIKKILNENVISPANPNRAIPNFVFIESSGGRMDEEIQNIQFHGENVLEVIRSLCEVFDLGFKVLPHGVGGFSFQLYAGVDRSYEQDVNPWVVFSPEYENLAGTTLLEKTSTYKNTALVYNEWVTREYSGADVTEDVVKTEVEVFNSFGEVAGLDRKEIFVQSYANHTKNDVGSTQYTDAEYEEILKSEGRADLADYEIASAFTGEFEHNGQFVINRDFSMGDIVSVENEYGQRGRCRIIELIYSQSDTGETVIPSFENVDGSAIVDY